ncbi:MAG: sensor histidine kinase [Thermoleophilia bacterium]
MNTRSDRLAERPPGLLDRIRASINNPSLMGEGGASLRYAKVQWSMILWRFLTLMQIPVLIAVCPSRFISTGYAAIFFGLALTYTIAYSWLATHTSAGGRRYFRIIDLLIGAALLIAAHEATLVYVMVFYTYACLLNRPDLEMRETIPAVAGMSLVFLVASTMTPDPFYTQSSRVSEFIIFYLWGLGIFVFSKLLSQASSLELDARLEDQRRSYRRSLHDDLGNTLCGLHYKIQSLRRAGSDELKQALAFLARGYERAIVVLAHLLDGIDTIADEDLAEALARTARWSRTEFGVEVEVATPEKEIRVSSTIRQEIILIVREAIANTAKHAGVKKARIVISRHRGRLSVAVTDFGTGFDSSGPRGGSKSAVFLSGSGQMAGGTRTAYIRF